VKPLGFSCPPVGDYCYGFGYPVIAGGPIRHDDGLQTVDFRRVLNRSAGRVIEAYPNGDGTSAKVRDPHFDGSLPTPSGLSGGPVFTDKAQICGVISSSHKPYDPGDRWVSYISLLAPLLEFELDLEDGAGKPCRLSVRDLVGAGYIEVVGELVTRPTTIPETISRTFGRPHGIT
jgi:hypothetical protein